MDWKLMFKSSTSIILALEPNSEIIIRNPIFHMTFFKMQTVIMYKHLARNTMWLSGYYQLSKKLTLIFRYP